MQIQQDPQQWKTWRFRYVALWCYIRHLSDPYDSIWFMDNVNGRTRFANHFQILWIYAQILFFSINICIWSELGFYIYFIKRLSILSTLLPSHPLMMAAWVSPIAPSIHPIQLHLQQNCMLRIFYMSIDNIIGEH